jgi:hypothetical protein
MHLSGTTVTYRRFLDFHDRPVGDELFRLLFLSCLREICPPFSAVDALPAPAQLAQGLRDPARRVHYAFPGAAAKYAEFRAFMSGLMDVALFRPSRGALSALLRPFDEHFAGRDLEQASRQPNTVRAHGLWLDGATPS